MLPQNFYRECTDRTKSERDIDKFLVKAIKSSKRTEDGKVIQELEEKYAQKQKKIEKEKINEKEKKFKEKHIVNVEIEEALNKLLKHLKHEEKSKKALELIKSLYEKSYEHLNEKHVFESIFEIIETQKYTKNLDKRKKIKEIFEFFQNNVDFQNFLEKEIQLKKFFEILRIEALDHNNIYTDDSHQFHTTMSKIKTLVNEEYNIYCEIEKQKIEGVFEEFQEREKELIQAELKSKEQTEILNSIKNKLKKKKTEKNEKKENENENEKEKEIKPKYEYTFSEKLNELIRNKENFNNYKLELLANTIEDSFQFYKNIWARSSINILFNELLNKEIIFNETIRENFGKIRGQIFVSKNLAKKNEQKRNILDKTILGNPLNSKEEVKDGRALEININGIDQWAKRQCGM